jgi:hypothetical protein
MNKTTLDSPTGPAHWDPKYPFDLVVAYEDTPTRNRAFQLYDHIAQQLLGDYDFQCSWWKFDHLHDPAVCEQAADAAANANMVILSLRGDKDLPPVFKAWLQGWASRRDNHKSALVMLCGGSEQSDGARRLQAYLHQVARQAKMDFFANTFELPKIDPPLYSLEALQRRAETVTPLLEEILHQPTSIPRWGINE